MYCYQNRNCCSNPCSCLIGPQGPVGPEGPTSHVYGTIYNDGTQSIVVNTAGTYVTVGLNTTGPANDTTVSTNEITITEDGTYAIYYRLYVSGASQIYTATVFNSGTAIAPATTTVAATQVSGESFVATLSAETIVTLSEGDVLSLGLTSNTTGTIAVGALANATLSVKKL